MNNRRCFLRLFEDICYCLILMTSENSCYIAICPVKFLLEKAVKQNVAKNCVIFSVLKTTMTQSTQTTIPPYQPINPKFKGVEL